MKNKEEENEEYMEVTHLVSFHGIKCYFNEFTCELAGTNRINDILLDIAVWVHLNLLFEDGFKLKILKKFEKE